MWLSNLYNSIAVCTKRILHVGANFLTDVLSGITVTDGSAQPGSVKMLCFLRLCHAV